MAKENFTITTGTGADKKTLWSGDVDFDTIMSTLTPDVVSSLAKSQLKIKARAVGLAALDDKKDVAAEIEGNDFNSIGSGGARVPEHVKTIRLWLEAKGVKGKDAMKAKTDEILAAYNSDVSVKAKVDGLTEQRKNMFNI